MGNLAQDVQSLLGIKLTSVQISAFELYERELLEWNQSLNLTAIQELGSVRVKHFLDSLSCLMVMHVLPKERVIDIGTGAGFPGLPLKIACPTMRLTLVESVKKKVRFCQHVIQIIGLASIEVIPERAEILGHKSNHREQYDWAVARAVANLSTLVEYLLPLVRVGGVTVAMKGESAPAEIHAAENAIRLLGGRLRRLVPVTLPGVAEDRYLVVIDKIAATPPTFPRRVGLPRKRPL